MHEKELVGVVSGVVVRVQVGVGGRGAARLKVRRGVTFGVRMGGRFGLE